MAAPRLTEARRAELEQSHKQAVRRLLRAESAALSLLRAPVATATNRIVAATAIASSQQNGRAQVLARVRAETAQLESEFEQAVRDARTTARHHSRLQIDAEVAPIAMWARANGSREPAAAAVSQHAAELDAFEAERAAAAMSAAWSSEQVAGFTRWERAGATPGGLPRFLDVSRATATRVDRHAAVQATTAYADEQQSFWSEAFGTAKAANDTEGESGEPSLPYGWLPGVFQVWSAILDRRTCPVCYGLDGEMTPAGRPFTGDAQTPLHNLCRCIVLTTFVDEGLSRKLPGMQIDYSALKADVKDYMRGQTLGGLVGIRHAAGFIEGTRQKNAPETLLRKVRDRRGYVQR